MSPEASNRIGCPEFRRLMAMERRSFPRQLRQFFLNHRGALWLSMLVAGAPALFAQLPTARLSTIFPPGGKVGTAFEVTISGVDLDDAAQLHFSATNISGTPKTNEITGLPDENKFIVNIASNAPLGICDVRVVGRFGISNPRAFVMGQRTETPEKSGNHSLESAAEISLGGTINGQADANAIDHFKFSAKKGQRILIDCAAESIDSRMQPSLLVCDPSNRELERNRRGGLLDFAAPADGQYVLKVHDFLYRGGAEYFYRLSVGMDPYIDFIFPPSGLPGTTNQYVVYGRNLPGSTLAKDVLVHGRALEQLTVEIALPADATAQRNLAPGVLTRPAAAVVEGIEYRLTTPQGISNPILVSLATAPVVAEQNPNDKPQSAQKVWLPCEFVGQLYPGGDQDWLTFDAKKGEIYWVEVFSHRLGLPTDPFALIQKISRTDKGEEQVSDVQELYDSEGNIGGMEFKTTTFDPASRFEVKEDGTFRIQVRDLFNRTESNPRHVYRFSLRKETPDFRLVALPQAPAPTKKDSKELLRWTTLLRRGETIPIKVLAFRRDGFSGEIALSGEGLPPGVSAANTRIDSGRNSGTLLLTATDATTQWSGVVRIVGKARIGDTAIVREARGGTVSWNVGDYNTEAVPSRLTCDFAIAVCGEESAPISILAAENRIWETTSSGKLKVPLTIVRRGEFSENLKLKAAGLSALDSLKELEVDGKATNATLEIDVAQNKVPAGTHTFYLQTQAKGKYSNHPEGAKLAEAAAKEAEKLAADLAAEGKKAADAVAAADKAAKDAEALAKSAAEKASAAKTVAEQNPADEKSAVARQAAEKEMAEAAAKAVAASEAKAAAEKSANEGAAKAKAAESKKAALAERAKAAVEKAKAKELTITAYSAPIQIKVTTEEKKLAAGDKK